jgi:3-oxoacyl-[acyl-carrier-protein] synthase II
MIAPVVRRRVAITGIGAVTPIGTGRRDFWEGVRAGRRGVGPVTRFDVSSYRTRIAGEIPGFDFADFFSPKRAGRLDRFAQLSIAAAQLALEDAGLVIGEGLHAIPETEMGVTIGSALGGAPSAEADHVAFSESGLHSVQPSLATRVFAGAGACNVAIAFQARGPVLGNSNSCASGAIAIGEAFRAIRNGDALAMFTGGVEAPLAPLTFAAFTVIKAMSTSNEDPARASRPFDARRDGFVMAEGGAILILEEMAHALQRDAKIYAEIVGFATTNDAFHMTAPQPMGRDAARAMRLAIRDASLTTEEIEAVNAHGSSTVLNDRTETLAIKEVLGERARRVPVSGTKGLHAHALGASGAMEAAIAALSVSEGFLPATANLDHPDPECDLDYVPRVGRSLPVSTVISNSFGFGGTNACLVFKSVPV